MGEHRTYDTHAVTSPKLKRQRGALTWLRPFGSCRIEMVKKTNN